MSDINYTILVPEKGRDTTSENRIANPFRLTSTFDELYELIEDNVAEIEQKEQAYFIIPAEFYGEDETDDLVDGYVRRCANNVKAVTILSLDVDGGMEVAEVEEMFSDYRYIIYTTFGHMMDGETQKFRVLFEVEQAVNVAQWKERRKDIVRWLSDDGNSAIDTSCLDLSRGFYLPSWNANNRDHFILGFNEGKKVDLLSFAIEEQREYVPSDFSEMTDTDRAQILEELEGAVIGSYKDWWQMVQAMKGAGFSLSEVIQVSAGNPNHCSTTTGIKDQELCESSYQGFSDSVDGAMGKLVSIIRRSGNADFRRKGVGLKNRKDSLEEQLRVLKRKKLKRLVEKGEIQ